MPIEQIPHQVSAQDQSEQNNSDILPFEIEEPDENKVREAYQILNSDLEAAQKEATRLNTLRKSNSYTYGVSVTPTNDKREYDIPMDKVEVIIVQNT